MKKHIWCLIFILLVLTGCLNATSSNKGAQVDRGLSVNLQHGQRDNQSWDNLYMTISYSYKYDGQNFDIQGIFAFSDGCQATYKRVDDWTLKLFALDNNMKVIKSYDILRTVNRDLKQKVNFSHNIKMPAKISAFTFSYDGTLIDDER